MTSNGTVILRKINDRVLTSSIKTVNKTDAFNV